MTQSAKYLLIGSTEAYSGKSATILGLARQFQNRGIGITYGKPIGSCENAADADAPEQDVQFVSQTLKLSDRHLHPTLLTLTPKAIERRLRGEDTTPYTEQLQQSYPRADQAAIDAPIGLLEGPSGIQSEGCLFGLSLLQMAQTLEARVLLVTRCHSLNVVEGILSAQEQLGKQLLGVLLNDIPLDLLDLVEQVIQPFLESRQIPVLGRLPHSALLRSISVAELVEQLKAEVLCCRERLDLMVESLKIGAMNVNAALEYFQHGHNMAVVTGGDRTDIQLAALETSTQCLILTGHVSPSPAILRRAEELEIPILSVQLDTLTTVEIVDHAFGQLRLHEPVKVQCIQELINAHFDLDRLLAALGSRF